jgi:hypothetical protein
VPNPNQPPMKKHRKTVLISISLSLTLVVTGGWLWLSNKATTIRGVPASILLKTLEDGAIRDALLNKQKTALHNRLKQMGVEEEIKAFYRPRIQDEAELDRYIHQIFYNNVGYVGDAYYADQAGILHYKIPPDNSFRKWFKLAYAAGVVIGSRQENGIQYVISPRGTLAPFEDIAVLFPTADLEKMIELKK